MPVGLGGRGAPQSIVVLCVLCAYAAPGGGFPDMPAIPEELCTPVAARAEADRAHFLDEPA